jgi:dCMP deaminase
MSDTSGSRPGWDAYFLDIAKAVAARADCSRRRVGAVIVKDNRIISTGYNGAPAGEPGCLSGACPRARSSVAPGSPYESGTGSCIAVHAEANALLYSDRSRCEGATLYLTVEPCQWCAKLIRGAGIARVVFSERLS